MSFSQEGLTQVEVKNGRRGCNVPVSLAALSWVCITAALKCLLLLTAEADGALGLTLSFPKHQSVWPRSKAGLEAKLREEAGLCPAVQPFSREPPFTTLTTAVLLHTIAKKTCKNHRLETCPWGR